MQQRFKINDGQLERIEIIKVMFIALEGTHIPFLHLKKKTYI